MNSIFTQHRQTMGDTLTPISCFLNLRDVFAGVALFESSDYASKANSKSFICAEPIVQLSAIGDTVTVRKGKTVEQTKLTGNQSVSLVGQLEQLKTNYQFETKELSHLNGFFGLVGYDAIPHFETVKFKEKNRFEELPDVFFAAYKYIVVFDNFTNKIDLLMNSFDQDFSGFDQFVSQVFHSRIYASKFETVGKLKSNETDDSFREKVLDSKEYIKAGEVFQMVISRSFSQPYTGEAFEVYRQLRALNPSPYMFYMELDKAKLFGASPEAQLRVSKGVAEIHPIAGTVKRTLSPEKDEALAIQLKNDKKENAEHTMLVDLARNDLNITCQDVKVTSYKKIQTFSHVIHMVSKVTGTLDAANAEEAFAKSFPAGTLSGAPKFRAMELIDGLEAENRGYYGGAIGHLSGNGDLNMAIIIRSCLAYKNELHYQAGAGIVYDSVPENEVQEVYNKIGAVQKAIVLANQNK